MQIFDFILDTKTPNLKRFAYSIKLTSAAQDIATLTALSTLVSATEFLLPDGEIDIFASANPEHRDQLVGYITHSPWMLVFEVDQNTKEIKIMSSKLEANMLKFSLADIPAIQKIPALLL